MNTVADQSPATTSIEGSRAYLLLLARLLMSSLFIWDGVVQLRNPGGTAHYFANVHVPDPNIAVWISIPLHLLGGLALLAGFYTRWAAVLLGLICLGTAFGVHLPAGDQANMINFYKNLVMAGGFLYVIVYGPGSIAVHRETA
jgi:putative oxidoreductase